MDDKDEWEDEEMDKDVAVPSTEPTVVPSTEPTVVPLPQTVESGLATTVTPEQVEDEIL